MVIDDAIDVAIRPGSTIVTRVETGPKARGNGYMTN
jgi:hypothetical protein